jgi:polygalacturonase
MAGNPKPSGPEPLHDPVVPPEHDPPAKPLHDHPGDPTYEPTRPLTEPTPHPAGDPPREIPRGNSSANWTRRELLKLAGAATLITPAMLAPGAQSAIAAISNAGAGAVFDVRSFGTAGDGKTIDSPAINLAIKAAGATGGTVYIPAGTYACYSLRLTSSVTLYLDQGAIILAADTPREGTASGYDAPESNAPWEAFQDFGHNHWHNSLIWGENIHDVAVLGPGLIWGRGLARGHDSATSSCAISRCLRAGTSPFWQQASTT